MTIERLQAHYGFTRMPFGRDLAPGMLHRHDGHDEAVARITWCVAERGLGVITGEVGAGKTVAVRAALAALDPTRHTIIYLRQPDHRRPRHPPRHRHRPRAAPRHPHGHPRPPGRRRPGRRSTPNAAAPRSSSSTKPTCSTTPNSKASACSPTTTWTADHPFACLLVGQPTLRRRIKLGILAALDQRIALRYTIAPMTADRDRQLRQPPPRPSPAAPTPCSPTTPPP